MRPVIRRLARLLLVALVVLVVVLGGAFGLAQTAAGHRWLADQLAALLAAPDGTPATVEGLEGFLPFDVRLARLALPDQDGIWLTAENLHVAWSPRALLDLRLQIDRISAARIEIARPPVTPEVAEPEPEAPFTPPQLPTSLPPVELRMLAVDALVLGEPVLGQAATFQLAGDLFGRDEGETLLLELSAKRTDQPTASLDLFGRADLASSVLAIDLSAEETGGLLKAVSGLPEAGDFRLSLAGEGPLEDWTGRLRLDADGLLGAAATLRLGVSREPAIGLVGWLRPNPALLPEGVAPLLGERIELALDIKQTEDGAVAVSGLRVLADALELTGEAGLDPDAEQLDTSLRLALPDLAKFEQLAGVPLAGKASLDLTANGPLLQPQGRLRLQAFDLEAAGVAGKSLATDVTFEVLQPLDQGEPAVALAGSGGLDQLALGAGTPNPFQNVTWEFGGRAPPEGELRLDRLLISTEVAKLEASAAVDRATFAGTAQASLTAPDLRPLTASYGTEVAGALALDLRADLAPQLETIGIALDGGLDRLADLPAGLGELLGERVTLEGKAEVAPAGTARLETLDLEAKAVRIGASAEVALDSQALTGDVTLDLPRLAALETLAGTDLAGGLRADATLGGTVSAPTVRLQATGENLAAAGQVLGRLGLTLDAHGLPATPEGSLSLDLQRADLEAALQTGFRLDGDTLAISGLELDAAGAQLGGDLTLDLARTLVEGQLDGRVADLGTLAPLAGMPLRGGLRLDAELQPEDGQQRAVLTLNGNRLGGSFGNLDRLRLRATVDDALGAPALDATLNLDQLALQGDVRVDQATVRAKGGLEALRLDAQLAGQAIEPIELTTAAEIALGEAIEVRITRLDGRFAETPLELARAARVRIAGPALAVQDLDLRFGDARLVARADLAPERSSLEADLADLPLELLASFGVPELEGTARADVRLQAGSGQPDGRITLAIADLRPLDEQLAEAPPLDLDLDARIGGDRLAADLTMAGLTAQPVEARAELPFVLRLAPFDLQLPPDGGISGALDLDLELARIAAIVGLDDQRLEGLLTGDLEVAGTLGEPSVSGDVRLREGVYENGATGTVLNQIVADIAIQGETVRIEQFTATDGGEGRLAIEGGAARRQDGTVQLDAGLRLDRATLVRRDDASGTISGTIDVDGDLTDRIDVVGRLTVDRAVVSIAGNPGPSVAALDVEEVGRGAPPAEEQAGAAAPPITIGLDVAIDIPGRVFVRGRGLESEWQGQLTVDGTAAAPRLTGHLEISRGRFDFVDKRFTIDRGRIDFSGEVPPAPTLDLQASSQGRNIKGIIRLSGSATDPRLTLSSEPPLPEDEVLAQLLFDKSANELGPGDALALAQTASALRGGGRGLDVLGRTRDTLGIDTLDVSTGDNPSDVNVSAGKYLTDDVYLEVERGTTPRSGKASVEIDVLPNLVPNLNVELQTTAEGQGGVGVNWRMDY